MCVKRYTYVENNRHVYKKIYIINLVKQRLNKRKDEFKTIKNDIFEIFIIIF